MYTAARCNEYYAPAIRINHREAEVEIAVHEKFFHSAGGVHGSVYFKLLDDAAFFAVNSLVEDALVLTASFNLYLLRPVNQGRMRAVGKVVNATNSSFLAESVLYDGEGNEIARGSGNFVKSKIKLTAEMGYK